MSPEQKRRRAAPLAIGLLLAGCVGNVAGGMDDSTAPGPGAAPGPAAPGRASGDPQNPSGSTPPATPGSSAAALPAAAETTFHRLTDVELANASADLLGLPRAGRNDLAAKVAPAPSGFLLKSAIDPTDLFKSTGAAEDLATAAVKDTTKLLGCDVMAANDVACVAAFITRTGKRAFRRPLDAGEVAAYQTLYTTMRDRFDRKSGVETVVRALLDSPHFLYLIEGLRSAPGATGTLALDSYEVAARLSFFLWSTLPDDELLAAADRGELVSPDKIGAQVTRMLGKKDLAAGGLARFHREWLELGDYPTADLALSAQNETDTFVARVILDGDGRVPSLLGAPYSFVDTKLAAFYGVAAPATAGTFAQTPLPDNRRGVLLLPMFLGSHASATASPIKRGKVLRQRLLCQDPPPPPPDVNVAPPAPSAATTTREKLIAHRKDPACAGCHSFIEPLGYGMEAFDDKGKFRTMDGNKPVDASGELTGTDVDGAYNGALELVDRLGRSKQVGECVAKQWYRFALHRQEDQGDQKDLDRVVRSLGATTGVRDLLVAIAGSESFRTRRVMAAK
jgi:hypothetical protein